MKNIQSRIGSNKPGRSIVLSAVVIVFFCLINARSMQAATRYFKERTFSAITASVADNVRVIVAVGATKGKHSKRFMKVGDSISASDESDSHTEPNSYSLCQFVCPDWTTSSNAWDYTRRLDTYKTALSPALRYYLGDTLPDGTTSFNHYSVTAQANWASNQAVAGNPCPLRTEINYTSPQCAIIMYGANDAGGYGSLYSVVSGYMASMHRIVDTCLAEGVVPMLMATCPRIDKMDIALTMSHLVRCLAQQHQTPFIDYHRAMMPLHNHGMGDDGLHPTGLGYNQYCWCTPAGLRNGYNLRNLLTLQALDRMYQITVNNVASLDSDPPALVGTGTRIDPFIIDSISFVDAQTTSGSSPDVYYKLVLTGTLNMRAMVTFQNGADIDISLLNGSLEVIATATSEAIIEQSLTAGAYYIKVQTSGTNYGTYQFIVIDRNDDGSPKGTTGAHTAIVSASRQQPFSVASIGRTIRINTNDNYVVDIFNVQGKVFPTNASPDHGYMQWRAPSAGTYFVRVKNAGTTRTQVIVVR